MEQNVCLRLLWQKTKKDEACLVRAFGNYDQTELPDAVFGCPLTEIAPYCFAQSAHFPPGEILETEIENTINIEAVCQWVKQKDIFLLEFLVRAGYASKATLFPWNSVGFQSGLD